MKNFLIIVSVLFSALFSKSSQKFDKNFQNYLDLLKNGKLGQIGNYKKGEIEVIDNVEKMLEAQELQKKKFVRSGLSENEAENGAKIGIIAEDMYWFFIRDAVIFPTGMMGSYNRVIKKSEINNNFSGAAVLPILKNKKILLIVNYRHATRSWQLEIPRGYSENGEAEIQTAKRELFEETGLEGSDFISLGYMNPDSGTISSCVPVYLAKVKEKKGLSNQDDSEAIFALKSFTKEEIKNILKKGFFNMSLAGAEKKVFVRDSFITFAIMQAELRNLL